MRPIHHALMGVARNLRLVRGATGDLIATYARMICCDPANRHNQLDFLDLGVASLHTFDLATPALSAYEALEIATLKAPKRPASRTRSARWFRA